MTFGIVVFSSVGEKKKGWGPEGRGPNPEKVGGGFEQVRFLLPYDILFFLAPLFPCFLGVFTPYDILVFFLGPWPLTFHNVKNDGPHVFLWTKQYSPCFLVKTSKAEGRRRFHKNTAYARLVFGVWVWGLGGCRCRVWGRGRRGPKKGKMSYGVKPHLFKGEAQKRPKCYMG